MGAARRVATGRHGRSGPDGPSTVLPEEEGPSWVVHRTTMILLDETDNSDGIAGGAAVFCEKQKACLRSFDRLRRCSKQQGCQLEDGQESIVFTPEG